MYLKQKKTLGDLILGDEKNYHMKKQIILLQDFFGFQKLPTFVLEKNILLKNIIEEKDFSSENNPLDGFKELLIAESKIFDISKKVHMDYFLFKGYLDKNNNGFSMNNFLMVNYKIFKQIECLADNKKNDLNHHELTTLEKTQLTFFFKTNSIDINEKNFLKSIELLATYYQKLID